MWYPVRIQELYLNTSPNSIDPMTCSSIVNEPLKIIIYHTMVVKPSELSSHCTMSKNIGKVALRNSVKQSVNNYCAISCKLGHDRSNSFFKSFRYWFLSTLLNVYSSSNTLMRFLTFCRSTTLIDLVYTKGKSASKGTR